MPPSPMSAKAQQEAYTSPHQAATHTSHPPSQAAVIEGPVENLTAAPVP